MTDILELAAKVEALDGPDREVDLDIWWQCKANRGSAKQPMPEDYRQSNLRMNDAPRYTASLDAAMTLVPEGRQLSMETYDHNGIYPAHVRASAWVQGAERCFAANLALALVAAALRVKGGEQ